MPVLQVEMIDADVMARVGRLTGRKVVALRPRRPGWNPTYKLYDLKLGRTHKDIDRSALLASRATP